MMKPVNCAICMALLAPSLGAVSISNAADTVAVVEARNYGSVPFVSGGVGEESRQQIEKLSPEFPLQLLFATKGTPNEYLADVKVRITDKDGKVVLEALSEGPFLMVKLAPGKYSVSADNEGAAKQQTVQITGTKPQRVVFIW